MRASRFASFVGPIAALVVLAMVVACGTAPGAASSAAAAPGPTARPAQVTPERIAAGKLLYEKGVCITCHMKDGAGGTNAPPLNDKSWLHGEGKFNQIRDIIINGWSPADMVGGYSRGMPQRGENRIGARKLLTDDEVTSVAAYVWSISHDMQ
jgi:mono/diheme cytochrome c family protein